MKKLATKKGKRSDINNIYFRSAWEANVARILQLLVIDGSIIHWEYEPDRFLFPQKRGNNSYTPDFKIWTTPTDFFYLEVKGYMDASSKTKLARMGKYYPSNYVGVVGKGEYNELKSFYKGKIQKWE